QAEQALDRAQLVGRAQLLQVSASERTGRGQSRAQREHAEAGQVSAGLSRPRTNRAAVSVGRAQGAGGAILRRQELRDSGAVLLDGDAPLRAARNQSHGYRFALATGQSAGEGKEGAHYSGWRPRPARAEKLRVEA